MTDYYCNICNEWSQKCKCNKPKSPKLPVDTNFIHSDYNSLDYFQGYFDCLRNITSKITGLQDRMKYCGHIATMEDIGQLYIDARHWEIEMWEQLKEKHGDNFKPNPFGRYEIRDV